MSVEITRIGGDPLGISQYDLKLNGESLIIFDHHRPSDLATLLRNAADVVEKARAKKGHDAYTNGGSKQW